MVIRQHRDSLTPFVFAQCFIYLLNQEHSLLALPLSLLALASLLDYFFFFKKTPFQISMVVQWIRILPANAGDIGSILGPGKLHMPRSN